jgi:hypothetical protein
MSKRFVCAVALVMAVSAWGHPQPTTLGTLSVMPEQVQMKLHVPLNELELAFGHGVEKRPEQLVGALRGSFEEYLRGHIHVVTPGYAPWAIEMKGMELAEAENREYGKYREVTAEMVMRPPAGASTREFTLNYDVILHQVVTHRAFFAVDKDWAAGQTTSGPVEIGVVRVDMADGRVTPLHVKLGEGSAWSAFRGMVALGMHHIAEGADHLMFLLVLLLPATLLVEAGKWGGFGGARYSVVRLVKIVTAFTLGHSVTLLAGALGWVNWPQQPIEVLIAASILVSAVHAVRPLFAGHENVVAAGFGLVHGLAFAAGLAELNLGVKSLVVSILGFNVGIELMQLFVLLVTMPWLILLSQTRQYERVRPVLAGMAGVAALAWIVGRVSGEDNRVMEVLEKIPAAGPWLVLGLAVVAGVSYLAMQKERGSHVA